MKWIKVKDKLPPVDTWIIYHAPGVFETGPQMFIGKFDGGSFNSRAGFFGGGEVTHWMPLPEIPE